MKILAKAALITVTSGLVLVGGALPSMAAPPTPAQTASQATTNASVTREYDPVAHGTHIGTADLPVVDPYISTAAPRSAH